MQDNSTVATTKATPPTISLVQARELLASTPGAIHVRALGAIMAPPTNAGSVARIVAFVEKPQPLVLTWHERVFNVNVTIAEDVLLSSLRRGVPPAPPEGMPEEERVVWESDQAALRQALRRFLSNSAAEDSECDFEQTREPENVVT